MKTKRKTEQLQIRLSPREKALIRKAAEARGLDISAWVLSKLCVSVKDSFQKLTQTLSEEASPSYALTELNDFLSELAPVEYREAVSEKPPLPKSQYLCNYLAAMVELGAKKYSLATPVWCSEIEPLSEPVFASKLEGLRLHLLFNSPIPFRNRNIFVDASLNDRV